MKSVRAYEASSKDFLIKRPLFYAHGNNGPPSSAESRQGGQTGKAGQMKIAYLLFSGKFLKSIRIV